MILFPGCKINVGLSILNKREDGYHNLESIFLPIPLFDSLEFIESEEMSFRCNIELDNEKSNSILMAYHLLKKDFDLPPISIVLHKQIPMGAGLGGGSANGAFMLVGLNSYFELGLSVSQLEKYALQIGSDCPFFIQNKPKLVHGVGEILQDIQLPITPNYIQLVNPRIHVSTRDAFEGLVINETPNLPLDKVVLNSPISQWKEKVFNDFEGPIFEKFPELERIKTKLYEQGAQFASMTGTGSTVYGFFENDPTLSAWPDSYFVKTVKLR
jgi:4-diphosphocytidyl-2-C-methyl-D-erythritol kinase